MLEYNPGLNIPKAKPHLCPTPKYLKKTKSTSIRGEFWFALLALTMFVVRFRRAWALDVCVVEHLLTQESIVFMLLAVILFCSACFSKFYIIETGPREIFSQKTQKSAAKKVFNSRHSNTGSS